MSRPSSHETHRDQLETWLNAMAGTLLPETAADLQHLSREQLDDNLSAVMSHNPAQDYSHKELAKIFGALTYNLIARVKWMKEKNSRLQQESLSLHIQVEEAQRNLAQAHDQLDQVQAGTQSQRETADEEDTELQEKVKGLQQDLTDLRADTARREQQEKDTQEELQQAKALLIRSETELKDRIAKAKAYERHLQSGKRRKSMPCVKKELI